MTSFPCPRCSAQLAAETVRSGANYCVFCSGEFEATTFRPPTRRAPELPRIIGEGPEEVAACANHARNAAVTNCQRCGLLICSLCDMNIGEGSFCPSCFERVRHDESSRMAVTRIRDYAGMARMAVIITFVAGCFAPVISPFAIYWAKKGITQRRADGSGVAGAVFVMIVALLQLAGALTVVGFLIYSLFQVPRT